MKPSRDEASQAATPPVDAYGGEEPFIFVSYAHTDRAVVYPEIKWLAEQGYRLWYDDGIDPGSDWPDEIALALDRSALLLVFISPHSVESKNVRNEIHYALTHNRPVVAVHLQETTLPKGLELRMGDIQAIMKYRTPRARYRQRLGKALSRGQSECKSASGPEVTGEVTEESNRSVQHSAILLGPPAEPVKRPPFHFGSVVPPEFFIDREEELKEAERIIRAGQGFLLVGHRRAGKTSFCKKLIHQIMGNPGNPLLATYLNLQNLQQSPGLTIETFLEHTILNIIGEIARQVFGCKYSDLTRTSPPAARESLRDDPVFDSFVRLARLVFERTHVQHGTAPSPLLSQEFVHFAQELLDIIRDKKWSNCVVFYDEANRLPRDLSVDLLIANREALGAAGVLSVYAASPEMAESFQPLQDLFDNRTVDIGPFREIEYLHRLLARYYFDGDTRKEDLPATAEALERLWSASCGKPFLIQLLADTCFRIAAGEQAVRVSGSHVDHAYQELKAERPLLFAEQEQRPS